MRAKTTTTASAASASPPWADLLPELLCNIACRLHVASDNVRFHAVCRAWRVAGDGYTTPPRSLLPWLLAPSTAADDQAEDQRCRCVFSHKSYRAPGICVRDQRVAYGDGKAAWLVRCNKEIRLVNPLSGDRLTSPGGERLSNEWLDHRHRIVSGDGSVLLYDFDPNPRQGAYHPRRRRFRASFLPPGHRKWLHVSSDLSADSDICCAAASYRGGYVVCVDWTNCYVLRPHWDMRAPLPVEPGKVRRWHTYLLKHRGELLLASVLSDAGRRMSVSLHELRLKTGRSGGEQPEVEWVRRDESDSDMTRLSGYVFFLGFPGSFALEAAQFGGKVSGGAAYFVIHGRSGKPSRVCRYRFGDAESRLVETLPARWDDTSCMWFLPDPQILTSFDPHPPEEGEGSEPAASSSAGKLQGCGNNSWGARRRHQLRIYAGHLSPEVDSSRLREMFSVYGEVAGARVAYDKRGRSRSFGFVTMATREGFGKAMAALNAVEKAPDDTLTILYWFLALLILLLIFGLLYIIQPAVGAARFFFHPKDHCEVLDVVCVRQELASFTHLKS